MVCNHTIQWYKFFTCPQKILTVLLNFCRSLLWSSGKHFCNEIIFVHFLLLHPKPRCTLCNRSIWQQPICLYGPPKRPAEAKPDELYASTAGGCATILGLHLSSSTL